MNLLKNDPIVITSFGMVSSLGLDVASSCAAARAGLSRAAELDFTVINSEVNQPEPVIGHAISGLTSGFEGIGKTLRIGQLAFEDLQLSTRIDKIDPKSCGLIFALPEPNRTSRLIVEEEEKNGHSNHNLESGKNKFDRENFISKFGQVTGFQVPSRNAEIVFSGHAGFTLALEKGMKRLQTAEWQHCIIGAIDSLLESPTLQWLLDLKSLKCSDNPVGLQPGEAGAFFVLNQKSRALQSQNTMYGIITAVVSGFENNYFFTEKPSLGNGLVQTVIQLNERLKNGIDKPLIITDLNGEIHRSTEWGYALVRLSSSIKSLQNVECWYPSISFGDTGAASGAVSLCTALKAIENDYAPSNDVLTLSSSDTGERGAIYIQKVNG